MMLGASACLIAFTPACADVQAEPGAPVGSAAPLAGGTTFTVGSLAEVVAADGRAWMLAHEEDGVFLSRVELDGRSTRVMSVPGQSLRLAPYGEGVVVLSVACADSACEETVSRVVVLDGGGSTISQQDLSRKSGPPEDSDSVSLIGIQDGRLWASAGPELISYDLKTGVTLSRGPRSGGVTCLLDGGLYSLSSLSGPIGFREDLQEPFDEPYEVVIEQLINGIWVVLKKGVALEGGVVPEETRRILTETELTLTECVGGSLRTGPADEPSPAWAPDAGWFEAEPYTASVNRGPDQLPFITKIARGQANQFFVLDRDGIVERLVAVPGAPLAVETIEVPEEVFAHGREGPPPGLSFDMSSSVIVGCVSQMSFETISPSRCYITAY
jgi:hypothetical protein